MSLAQAREALECQIWRSLPAGTAPEAVDAVLALADEYARLSRIAAEIQEARRALLEAEMREAYGHLGAATRPERGRAAA